MKMSGDAVTVLHQATAIYTRDPVVDKLLDLVKWPSGPRRLLEPSCGDGAFLVAAVRRLLRVEPKVTAERILDIVQAYEVYPPAAEEARGRVQGVLIEHGWPGHLAAQVVRGIILTKDFLTEGPTEECCDVIAGNPPYLRWANVPGVLQDEYEPILPDHAKADLLYAFLDRCSRVLSPSGEIAFVTADRWLFNGSAKNLREALGGRKLAIHHVERLDATTSFYRPKDRSKGTPPRIHPVAVVLRATDDANPVLDGEPTFPGGEATSIEGEPLGEVAEVRLAPWLGKPGIFLVKGAVAAALPQDSLVPAVDTEEIRGAKLGEVNRYAIKTRPDVEPPAAVLEHLREALVAMAPRGRREPFWLPPESWHNWDLSRESLVVPRITKRLRCVRLPAGVLPTNHSLSVVTGDPALLDRLEAYLNGELANAWMQSRAPPLDGGYMSVTTRLLCRLPVPAEVA